MSVDLSKLSSKELFELAKKREQEEQEAKKRKERLKSARIKREELIAQHEEILAATDKALKDLEQKRISLINQFEATIAPLDREITELEQQVKTDAHASHDEVLKPDLAETVSPAPLKEQITAPSPQPAPSRQQKAALTTADELYDLIRGMLRNRSYISESLLKEKLKTSGYDMVNFRQQLEQLIQNKRIDNKGHGNYALGKRK